MQTHTRVKDTRGEDAIRWRCTHPHTCAHARGRKPLECSSLPPYYLSTPKVPLSTPMVTIECSASTPVNIAPTPPP
jgi:hypothetical protein